jgi:hypothetical protein
MKNLIRNKPYLVIVFALFLLTISVQGSVSAAEKQQYYEVKIYHVSNKTQANTVDNYLKDVYLPALHRAGIPVVGVFKPIESDTAWGKLIYVFIPFKTVDQFSNLNGQLVSDRTFAEDGRSFCDAPFDKPPYDRLESIFLKAFSGMPQFDTPVFSTPPSERIYELRSYESSTETKAMLKIRMFNQGGEIALFKSLDFHPVFFAQVLVGSHMPNLMYMTTFSDIKSHDQHWKTFVDSEGWKKLSGLEEYNNTVSKANPYLLHPTSYSDF